MPRPRKSLEKHILDGTYRADRHGPIPAELANLTAKPLLKPAGLSPDASAFWDRVIATRNGAITESDGLTLAVLAEWHATWLKTLSEVQAAEPKERLKLIQQLGICSTNFERLARKFGLTPADRESVTGTFEGRFAMTPTRPKDKYDLLGDPKKWPAEWQGLTADEIFELIAAAKKGTAASGENTADESTTTSDVGQTAR